MLPARAWGGSVGCRSLLQKSVLQHSIVLLVWALGESCQSHQSINQTSPEQLVLLRKNLCVKSGVCVYLALEVWAFILHAAGGEDGLTVLVLLDDGKALTISPEDKHTHTHTDGKMLNIGTDHCPGWWSASLVSITMIEVCPAAFFLLLSSFLTHSDISTEVYCLPVSATLSKHIDSENLKHFNTHFLLDQYTTFSFPHSLRHTHHF